MSIIANALPEAELPRIFYCHTSRLFWLEDRKQKWIQMAEEGVKRDLKLKGVSASKDDTGCSDIDRVVNRIQLEQNVDYAGGLAGYNAGPMAIGGHDVLITESPRRVEPRQGVWSTIGQLLDGMFVEGCIDQRPFLYGWLKVGLQSYYFQRRSNGQVLCLVGSPSSGKSLLQNLITKIFGGRSADPYAFMTGRTPFNSDLIRAEHLMMEDKAESIDTRSRRAFGARIKEITANADQQCHGKYKEALTLRPIWRLSVSLNDDPPERLLVLPMVEKDIEDKIILLKVGKRPMPMPTNTGEEREQFMQRLEAELPAFIHFLLHEWEIPSELGSSRYGITHFHHPEIMTALHEHTPEARLLSLIDEVLFPFSATKVADTASGIAQRLLRSDAQRQAQQLLYYDSACGTYLSRLAVCKPDRVRKTNPHGISWYEVFPPAPGPTVADKTNRLEGLEGIFNKVMENQRETAGKAIHNGKGLEKPSNPSNQTAHEPSAGDRPDLPKPPLVEDTVDHGGVMRTKAL